MSAVIPLDGASGEGGGQILRAALALSVASGQGFHVTGVRAGRTRPGLRPQHLAAVRAVAMASGATVTHAFEGSLQLRFEPGPATAGDYAFEIGTAGSVTLVLQALVPALSRATERSRVRVAGGTHVPSAPPWEYFFGPFAQTASLAGQRLDGRMVRPGLFPRGGGDVRVDVLPGVRPEEPLDLSRRGALVSIHGHAGSVRLPGTAERMRDAATQELWERQRLEASWHVDERWRSDSPGAWVLVEAVFERGRAAFGALFDRRSRPESVGARVARELLHFLEREEAVDPHLADQLVVPMALGRGGRALTSEVTLHLQTVVDVARAFGIEARVDGRVGGPGLVEVVVP